MKEVIDKIKLLNKIKNKIKEEVIMPSGDELSIPKET
jgi:hypothetical protein